MPISESNPGYRGYIGSQVTINCHPAEVGLSGAVKPIETIDLSARARSYDTVS